MSITLLQLRTQARDRADMANSQFISDDELNNYINASIAELHDLLIACYDAEYFLKSTSFNTTANTADYTLPTDFYKLKGVDVRLNGGDYTTLRPFNFNERNNKTGLSNFVVFGIEFRYRLVGGNLSFSPAPDNTYDVKLWYVPVATKLTSDSDTLNDLNQYSEYVITDAAIKMAQKEESDVSILAAQKLDLRKRIENMAQNRDAANPESISDIYAETSEYFYFRE